MTNHHKIRWRNRLIAWFPWISRVSETRRLLQAAGEWRRDGWTVPLPYAVRRAMLLSQARSVGAEIFIETGTFLGGTTWSLRNEFRLIQTIEVEPSLAALAKERFKKQGWVKVIEGDSSLVLPDICKSLDAPCLFYLDGHCSGGITGMGAKECPVIEELQAILKHTRQPFRIVIDDARLFGTDPTYPELGVLEAILAQDGTGKRMRIENDAILIE